MYNKLVTDTTVGRSFTMSDKIPPLLSAAASRELSPIAKIDTTEIYQLQEEMPDIGLLQQPLYVERASRELLFIDQRPFVSSNLDDRRVTNQREYDNNLLKGLLINEWINISRTPYRSQLTLVGAVYTTVVSNAISTTFNLDARQAAIVAALTAMFYGQLMMKDLGKYDATRAMFDINKFSNLDGGVSRGVADTAVMMDTLTDFTKEVIRQVNSKKIEKLNPGVLLTSISRVSFGYNIAESIGVGLEYPPVWAALVYAGAVDRSFKNSRIGKVTLAQAKLYNGEDLIKYIDHLKKQIQ